MKVLHLSTFPKKGGASKAAWRLVEALAAMDVDANLLCQRTDISHPSVTATSTGWKNALAFSRDMTERIGFVYQSAKKEYRFQFSPGTQGESILQHPLVKDADILHLHWVNKGFLSLDNIGELAALGKPVVWTLHDQWAFTGGCHYPGNCDRHLSKGCGGCKFFKNPSTKDPSRFGWQKRMSVYSGFKYLSFVCPSHWMAGEAGKSALIGNFGIKRVANPIDTGVYRPLDKEAARLRLKLPKDKRLILFSAMNLDDSRKGFNQLLHSLSHCEIPEDTELVMLGKWKSKNNWDLPIKVHHIPPTDNDDLMVEAFSACDVVCVPSLQDNLPNIVLESMACGTPVVSFRAGGIPEMVNHKKNGFLAELGNFKEICSGIKWILEDDERRAYLGLAARKFVVESFSYPVIGKLFQEYYRSLLDQKRVNSLSPSFLKN